MWTSSIALPAACCAESASLQATHLGFASALAMLSQFRQRMAQDGMQVDTRRMRADSAYALDQLALAHTSNNTALRECAMRVFALFHA